MLKVVKFRVPYGVFFSGDVAGVTPEVYAKIVPGVAYAVEVSADGKILKVLDGSKPDPVPATAPAPVDKAEAQDKKRK